MSLWMLTCNAQRESHTDSVVDRFGVQEGMELTV